MRSTLVAFLAVLSLGSLASAHGSFVTTWVGMYPDSTTADHVVSGTGSACMVCHWGPNGGPAWNSYGWRIRDNLNAGLALTDAIGAAGSVNSDGDPVGAASLIEIGAGTQPGWTPGPHNTLHTPTGDATGLNPASPNLGTLDPGSALLVYCSPGLGGVLTCPCSNPPLAAGLGCNNSDDTGGASISATGLPSIGGDTIVFTTAGQKASASSILLQGSAQNSGGIAFGQGVRCVAGSLKRMYLKSASGGSISAPAPGDLSVSARSAALGDPLGAGMQREYVSYYRDPVLLGGCAASNAFNSTSSGTLVWLP
jgi:hypothetical protein